ncbi:hypothetical protein FACS1894122_03280 [Alphaproteobacteria bacterium]|nr:hypothetical protein FACS1894122_03280 [Alphaproteobacteria bacterium]
MLTNGEHELSEGGLSGAIRKNFEKYFDSHDEGVLPSGLYDRVINEVERIMFEVTLRRVNGNQMKAAKILGINRNTLRKKMQQINPENNDS